MAGHEYACRRVRSRASGSVSASGAPRRSATDIRGDLVVEVKLVLPTLLDERSKELLREFARINGENVRQSFADPGLRDTETQRRQS
jgi:DnaJ-class molecular chaperone